MPGCASTPATPAAQSHSRCPRVLLTVARESRTMSDRDERISVLAVDDHPLLLDGIEAALTGQPDMHLIGVAADGDAGIAAHRRLRPDVTLMDLQMPVVSGLEALRTIRGEFPEARIVVLSTYRGDVQVMSALKSGAAGFLLKGML